MSKILFSYLFPKPMQVTCKECISNKFIKNHIFKTKFERIDFNSISIILCKQSPFAKFIKFYGKSYFILKTCFLLSHLDTLNFRKFYKVV
jgi:hypothetical protein